MARPKLGEGETERLHIKFSAEEVTAIDDWRFANRADSRSEAVRKLCQIAILSHDRIREIQAGIEQTERQLSRASDDIQDSLVEHDPFATLALARDRLNEVVRFLAETNSRALRLAEQMRFIQTTPDFDAEYEKAKAANEAIENLSIEDMLA